MALTNPQSPEDIAAIEALAGAKLPAAYRAYLAKVGAVEFDPPREIRYEYPDDGLMMVSWIAVTDMLGRDGVEKAMTAWWSQASGEYLPPGFLVIGTDGAFSPLLLGFGAREGVWYLSEPVAHPWQPGDDALLTSPSSRKKEQHGAKQIRPYSLTAQWPLWVLAAMRPRRVRNPIEATDRGPTKRPDTYERLPKSCQILDCEQQPTHTSEPGASKALLN